MNTPLTPCYVCGTPCKDWGGDYLDVCETCDLAYMRKKNIGIHGTAHIPGGNGWGKGYHKAGLDELKKERANAISPTVRLEGNCKQCGRLNDLGVKKCWFCETDNPVIIRS